MGQSSYDFKLTRPQYLAGGNFKGIKDYPQDGKRVAINNAF